MATAVTILGSPSSASAGARTKVVTYRGYHVTVPSSWPVYHLSANSTQCVRFDTHAVYLGQPGANQVCPTAAAGRTEAIEIAPLTNANDSSSAAAAALLTGTALRLVNRAHDVVVTATWGTDPSTIERALDVHSATALQALASTSRIKLHPAATLRADGRKAAAKIAATTAAITATAAKAATATTSTTATTSSTTTTTSSTATPTAATVSPAEPGEVFNGYGFDACSTPSTSTMSAWSASPFRAIGVYIGGVNMACTQTNLTSSWVSTESAAGWHLILIYVGLQASGACSSCAAINSTTAAAEGTQAAISAVAEAQALGIGTGNPIYDDMEAYSRTTANSAAVLAYLQAWTIELNTAGYLSGVYSSDASGIRDLAAKYGTGYTEPNEIWFANWNNAANVTDSYASTTAWPAGQRLHQYAGAENATYGKKTINIDADFVDSATAAGGGGATAAAALPTATSSPTVTGTPLTGQLLGEQHANWSGYPNSYSYQWERCNRSLTTCTTINGATSRNYRLTTADLGDRVKVLEDAKNGLGAGTAADSSPTYATHKSASGYWTFTANGHVYNSLYEPFFGSPASSAKTITSTIVGMVGTSKGYWLATRSGHVYSYGAAAALSTAAHSGVVGIAASGHGGYWLVTAAGRVFNSRNATWYGSATSRHVKTHSIVGIAATTDGHGYWLVSSSGKVYAFGDARTNVAPKSVNQPIAGIVASPRGGYWIYTPAGNVYRSRGNSWYGAMGSIAVAQGTSLGTVAGMTSTSDGRGYWLFTTDGSVWPFGDAATYPTATVATSVAGAA